MTTVSMSLTMRVFRVLFVVLATGAVSAQQHDYTPADVEQGARLYTLHCAACHGPDGDMIPSVDLRRGQFRRGSSDDELIRTITRGIPGTPMPPTSFPGPQVLFVVAYIRSLHDFPSQTSAGGDPARGRAWFEGKGACLTCHRVKDKGSRVGPDLSDIGAIRRAAALERSILNPNDSILPQHRFIRAVTRDGVTITGRRLNEDTHTLQLIDSNERLVSVSKADLREYGTLQTSPMPSYQGKLSSQELADIVSYLVSLKGSDTP